MVEQTPLVSVVIPCFNQAHYLGEAIESVIAQTYPAVEIIVVDDGSPDDPEAVVSQYPGVRLIRQSNRGVSAARNSGLQASRGEYLVFLDADDRLLPDALETSITMLQQHLDCGYVYGLAHLIDAAGSPLPPPKHHSPDSDFFLTLLERNDIWSTGQVVYRRDAVEGAMGFDGQVSAAADLDLNLRIASEYRVCLNARPVFEYRLYPQSMNHNSALMLAHTMSVYRTQQRHVAGRAGYMAAWERGRLQTQAYYGNRLADEIGDRLRARQIGPAIKEAMTLLRYYPRGLADRIVGKIGKYFFLRRINE